ncbi:MAG: DNA integrity scanning diadenylate cyclase DisA, partial [Clostridia bacterium]
MTRHEALVEALRRVAPGTMLREGLDSIVRAHTGALVVVGGEPEIDALMQGGFRLDAPFVPSALYELAKMDGAIVVDEQVDHIRAANVQLTPTLAFRSEETGIRHRTAERVARQTGALVIAVSERRNVVTVYRSNLRYVLHDPGYLLVKATQAISSLVQYDKLLASELSTLALQEWQGQAAAGFVAQVLRRGSLLARTQEDISVMVAEMGREGRMVEWQMADVQDELAEVDALWRDYGPPDEPYPDDPIAKSLSAWGERIGVQPWDPDQPVEPRGFRFLTRLSGLSADLAGRVLEQTMGLAAIRRTSEDDLMQWHLLSRFEKTRLLAARRAMDVRARDRSAEVEYPEG